MRLRTSVTTLLASATLLALPVALLAGPAASDEQSAKASPADKVPADAAYKNANLPTNERVADLLSRMTLGEKIAQITALWENKVDIQDQQDRFDPTKASALYPDGIGQISRPSDTRGPGSPRQIRRRSTADSVAYVNAVQNWQIGHTRLGIPVLFHEESLHGLAVRDGTSYPQAIGLASTWDPDLMRTINAEIAGEAYSRGVHLVLAPVVDVARDPRWGRIEETFGEDPFLVGEMGVAAVEGLQGPGTNPKLAPGKVMATLKHMTGHGQPESGTNTGPAPYSERTLREMFFPPFQQVVTRTSISAVMASYNEIDGIPSHVNRWLLTGVLRGEWHYKGAVVSDYYALEDLARLHHVVADYPSAAKRALEAGVDDDLPVGGTFRTLAASVLNGSVPIAEVDAAVARILTLKFNSGLFEHPYADLKTAQQSDGPAAVALARLAAERSLVLLKNDGALPLALPTSGGAKPTIAMIGPSAAVARLGGYYGDPRATVSPLEGVKALVGSRANIVYSEGVKITENDDWWEDKVTLADPAQNRQRIAAAVEAAKSADQIVLFIGDTEQTSREGWAPSHLGDRSSLDLVGEQQALFDALKALRKPVIVVLVNGRPPSYPGIAANANAILESWYPGEQGGNAIARALFGLVNPGGKLPVTVARDVGQLPIFYNYKPSAHRGYLFGDATPLYPFGWGLSYTTFAFGQPALSASIIKPGAGFSVTTRVTNTGTRGGDEVVQVYLRDEVSSVTRPVKELVGFQRVTLASGESRNVTIAIRPDSLAVWNDKMQRVVEPGAFTIMVGPNSQDLQTVSLAVTP
jgi:beta-glucosidase